MKSQESVPEAEKKKKKAKQESTGEEKKKKKSKKKGVKKAKKPVDEDNYGDDFEQDIDDNNYSGKKKDHNLDDADFYEDLGDSVDEEELFRLTKNNKINKDRVPSSKPYKENQ